MHILSMVMNSDQVNRYGTRFPLNTLLSALRQSQVGTPMFISHDMLRPVGWTVGRGIALHAGVNYLMGTATLPSNAEEEREIEVRAQDYVTAKLAHVQPEQRSRLEDAAGEHFAAEKAAFMSRECATLVQDGIAKTLFPNLFPEKENDKRGLIPLSELKVVGPGVYEVKDGICVFAHRFLRRSASRWNNLNIPFLERFQQAAKESADFEARIALDPDAIGLADTYMQAIELEYWWGPSFSDNLAEIDTSITRHGATERERLFHRIERTEFWWYDQNDLRAFECEEVLNSQTLGIEGEDKYACRYAHSMVDLATNEPHHLDGAVRIYNDAEILDRLELDMAKAGRRSEYVKLWRADGKIPVPLWKALVSDYFRDNHLVSEYLGAKVDPTEVTVDRDPTWEAEAPLEFAEDHSPAYLVSIFPRSKTKGIADVHIFLDDALGTPEGQRPAADLVSIDLLKRLERSGLHVQRPDSLAWISFADMHAELPRIEVTRASASAEVCRCLAGWLRDRGQIGGATTTGSLEFSSETETLRLAFVGAPTRLAGGFELLARANTSAFTDAEQLLLALHPSAPADGGRQLRALEAVRPDATFELGRRLIPPTILVAVPGQPRVEVTPEIAKRLGAPDAPTHGLYAVHAYVVKESRCDECGTSYLTCTCEGVQRPEESEALGLLLTRHPA